MLREETLTLDRNAICGIVTCGETRNSGPMPGRPVVVLFSAGLVHRVGPNRLHVKLARALAEKGFSVCRVDFNGQGDSLQQTDGATPHEAYFLHRILDTLEKKLQVNLFILAGLCSGADTAYRFSLADDRVTGLVMINGSGLADNEVETLYPMAEERIRRRYYKKAAWDLHKWTNIIKGRSKLFSGGNLRRFLTPNPKPAHRAPVAMPDPYRVIVGKGIRALVIVSEGSVAYDLLQLLYPRGIRDAVGHQHPVGYRLLPDADHIITPAWAQQSIIQTIGAWLDSEFPITGHQQPGSHEAAIQ